MKTKNKSISVSEILKNKDGFSYIQWCFLIIFLAIIMAFALSYVLGINIVVSQEKVAKQILDSYVEQNAISIYSEVKESDDYTAELYSDDYIANLVNVSGLTWENNRYYSRSENGVIRYMITKPALSFIEDYTPKIVVKYTIFIPLEFNGDRVEWISIPVTIASRFVPKFDENTNGDTTNIAPVLSVTDPGITTDTLPAYAFAESHILKGTVSDENGVAFVTANGIPAVLNENGTWEVEIDLAMRMNKIAIVAVDNTGKSSSTTVYIYRKGEDEGSYTYSVSGYTGIYDGNPHGINVIATDATITYATSENGTYSSVKPTYTNAGTYTTWYKIEKTGYLSYNGSETVKINKAPGYVELNLSSLTIPIPWLTTSEVKTNVSGGAISITSSNTSVAQVAMYSNTGFEVWTSDGASPGTAIITVTSAETANYTEASATFTVTTSYQVSKPTQNGTLTYNGSTQSPSWKNYDSSTLTMSGTVSAINAGTYYATFTPKQGYMWSDRTTGPKTVEWTIGKAAGYLELSESSIFVPKFGMMGLVEVVKNTSGGVISAVSSDDSIAEAGWDSYAQAVRVNTGYAGTATVTVTAAETANYTAATATFTVTSTEPVTIPSYSGTLTYNGTLQAPNWINYDSSKMTISGTQAATNAGTYSTTFTLKPGYMWDEGNGSRTTTPKTIEWTINKAAGKLVLEKTSGTINCGEDIWFITVSVVTNASGGSVTAVSSDTNIAYARMEGDWCLEVGAGLDSTPGTATVTLTAAETENYTAASTTFTVTNAKAIKVAKPTQNMFYPTYNGSVQYPTWDNYNSEAYTVGGTTSATDAGTYYAVFNLKPGYVWSDGTSTVISVPWTISKATGKLVLSSSNVTITNSNGGVAALLVTTNLSGGELSFSSSNQSVAMAYPYNATSFDVVGMSYGSTTIIVTAAETKNYTAATATLFVTYK